MAKINLKLNTGTTGSVWIWKRKSAVVGTGNYLAYLVHMQFHVYSSRQILRMTILLTSTQWRNLTKPTAIACSQLKV
jgi:hypothetical protein